MERRTRHLTALEVVRALTLLDEGRSQRYVARILGVHHSSVNRALRRFRETGCYTRRQGQGRSRKTTERDDRFLRQTTLRNRMVTSVELQQQLRQVRNVQISAKTVRRRLREAGLTNRRPATGPLLTRRNRVARLRFAREHVGWTIQQWKQVLFSDETRVSLKSPDGRGRTWRRPGERFAECTFSPRVPFGGGSIMFWGGICYEARTELVVVRGASMNARRYVENILQDHVVPFAPLIGEEFLFMQDNARPHVGIMVLDYLHEVGIRRMDWPPKSADMNPIEHVWDLLKKRVRQRIPTPENLQQLEQVVLEEWENIPQETIQNLLRGMQRRMLAVIRARGGNTRY